MGIISLLGEALNKRVLLFCRLGAWGYGGRKEERVRNGKILNIESEECLRGLPDRVTLAEVPEKGLGPGLPNKKIST